MCSSWWNEKCRGNRTTRRKPAPVPLCPPQIPHDLGRRGGKPATNFLSYDTACYACNCPHFQNRIDEETAGFRHGFYFFPTDAALRTPLGTHVFLAKIIFMSVYILVHFIGNVSPHTAYDQIIFYDVHTPLHLKLKLNYTPWF
jgi:hypothetical protein